MKLDGQMALVTGASRGIGRAIALALAREGATVAVTARSTEDLAELVGAIKAVGGKATAIAADLAERGAVDLLLEQAGQALGQIDILVNNAGVGSSSDPRPVIEFDDAFWDLTLYLNLTVPYRLSKGVLREMMQRRHGRIINIASIAGKMGSLHGAAYAASKHGLLGLTRTLALEVVKDGITVNAICPGPVHTAMNDKRIEYDAQRLGRSVAEHEATVTPMGRRVEPEEIAPLAVYLASREAAVVTGQAYNIDGGVLMM